MPTYYKKTWWEGTTLELGEELENHEFKKPKFKPGEEVLFRNLGMEEQMGTVKAVYRDRAADPRYMDMYFIKTEDKKQYCARQNDIRRVE